MLALLDYLNGRTLLHELNMELFKMKKKISNTKLLKEYLELAELCQTLGRELKEKKLELLKLVKDSGPFQTMHALALIETRYRRGYYVEPKELEILRVIPQK